MKLFQSFISLTILLLLVPIDHALAQIREMRPLKAEDFKCLQSLDCIKSSESLKVKGWSFVFDETVTNVPRELTARMTGKNISFLAVYDKDGKLVRSKYKRRNIALPPLLLSYLAEDTYKGWKLATTEMIMKNFDESTIRYKVELEKNGAVESEIYDMAFISSIMLDSEEYVEN